MEEGRRRKEVEEGRRRKDGRCGEGGRCYRMLQEEEGGQVVVGEYRDGRNTGMNDVNRMQHCSR